MFKSIQSKILAVFLLALFFGAVFSIYLYLFIQTQKDDLEQARALDEISLLLSNISLLGREFAMTGDPESREKWLDEISLIENILSEPRLRENLEKKNFKELKIAISDFELLINDVLSEDFDHSDEWLIFNLLPLIQRVEMHMNEIFRKDFTEMSKREEHLFNTIIAAVIFQLSVILILCIHTYRSIVRPLKSLQNGFRKMGQGDLNVKLSLTDESEFKEIFETFNRELAKLGEMTSSRDALQNEINERIVVQEQLEVALDKIHRANQELQQFAYVASHDLQEPLRMVASFTQLLEKRYGDSLDDDAKRWIGFAVDGARRMKILIEELLRFSRLETEKLEIVEAPLEEVLQIALDNLAMVIDETEATISSDPLPIVQGDKGRLVSLFQNLIGNAIKYRKKEIPPEIRITVEQGNRAWIFRISDNGIGIHPDYADKIFVIFQRLHGRGEYEGTGIGLALCRRIVAQHGGTLDLELDSNSSDLAHGSVFRFTLKNAAIS